MTADEQRALQAMIDAFGAALMDSAAMRHWQTLHQALFGAPLRVAIGPVQAEEKDNGTDKGAGT